MKRFLLLILIAGLAGGGYYGYRNHFKGGGQQAQAQATGPGQAAGVPVEVGAIELASVNEEVEALGTLAADESVVIAPEMAGRVVALGFKEGEKVAKDQKLVMLDTAMLDAELKQAQADLSLARDTHDRNRSLVQRGSGTQVALEQATAQLASQEAKIQLVQAKLALATIKAPFTGVVGLRAVGVGDYVSVGKQLITLTNIDPIKVDFRVPEIYMTQLKVGQPIQLKVDAVPDRPFTGQVFAIDPVVDVNGRAVRLRATIPNGDLVLKPGLFARVTVVVDKRDNALLVPETAVVPDGVGKAVFVIEGGKARRMPVELGKRLLGKVEVVKGLKPGQQIVTAGQMRLRDGSAVAIKEKAAVQTSALPGVVQPGNAQQ
ncbi:efflux RND transporter periplasmic adaptor subunit [Bosea sp. (in: a-proteobacteria)]|jgi:membrane fusion protein (multidrug efflux system)|uniref:efflux RND transporter periplasmic adaptor subunit n=1 Tax=Bosea sp. (in: a-proteobacteria) TaxID=1871050 RepID=UPI002DDD2DE4|nr:efflux RND transporter periplasmic adaptor subunit [Bosea sp. (in: a-proteobacteria)]HEV2508551.1 efflux RND transporter periplasmic adaptor subunit [Bosea sp. (in: a-proteobacteria)]